MAARFHPQDAGIDKRLPNTLNSVFPGSRTAAPAMNSAIASKAMPHAAPARVDDPGPRFWQRAADRPFLEFQRAGYVFARLVRAIRAAIRPRRRLQSPRIRAGC